MGRLSRSLEREGKWWLAGEGLDGKGGGDRPEKGKVKRREVQKNKRGGCSCPKGAGGCSPMGKRKRWLPRFFFVFLGVFLCVLVPPL